MKTAFQILTSFRTPTCFQFLNEKLYFVPYTMYIHVYIAESANIAEYFGKKLSAILGLLCSYLKYQKPENLFYFEKFAEIIILLT